MEDFLGVAAVILLAVLVVLWIAPMGATSFYVEPCYGQYCVTVAANGLDTCIAYQLTAQEAAALADKLNGDVGNKWRGQKR